MSVLDPTQIHIGRVIRNAIVFNVKHWCEGMVNTDSLLGTVARLFALLEERRTDYLLVGGIALLQYVEGRNTEDIDLIMTPDSLQNLPEITHRRADFARGTFDGLRIALLLTSNRLFDWVRQAYATVLHFAERDIRCATVEGLLLLKLYAPPSLYRQGNFARVGLYENDIATLLQRYQPPLEPLFDELAGPLGQSDLASVREVVAEIQQRLERFRRKGNGNRQGTEHSGS